LRDGSCEFILELKHIAELAIMTLRPDVVAGTDVNQLRDNAHVVANAADFPRE